MIFKIFGGNFKHLKIWVTFKHKQEGNSRNISLKVQGTKFSNPVLRAKNFLYVGLTRFEADLENSVFIRSLKSYHKLSLIQGDFNIPPPSSCKLAFCQIGIEVGKKCIIFLPVKISGIYHKKWPSEFVNNNKDVVGK